MASLPLSVRGSGLCALGKWQKYYHSYCRLTGKLNSFFFIKKKKFKKVKLLQAFVVSALESWDGPVG